MIVINSANQNTRIMKKIFLFSVLSFFLFPAVFAQGKSQGKGKANNEKGVKKVAVCHKGKKTLYLPEPAVEAHLAHGDQLGECGSSEDVRKEERRQPVPERERETDERKSPDEGKSKERHETESRKPRDGKVPVGGKSEDRGTKEGKIPVGDKSEERAPEEGRVPEREEGNTSGPSPQRDKQEEEGRKTSKIEDAIRERITTNK